MAVRDGRIVGVGDEAKVLSVAAPQAQRLHLPGRMVVPGFQDAHVHAPFAGRDLLRVHLNDLAGKEAYLAAISTYARENPDEEWIAGGGWAMEYFPGGSPSKEDLDRIVPDRPVFLFNRDVHGAWVNSAALRIGGITAHTPDPADGRIERTADGEPSGMLQEGAAYTYRDRFLPVLTRQDWEAAILHAQEYLHSLGITGWQDAWVTPDTLAAYRSLADDGRLTARVAAALWWERHQGLEQIRSFTEQASWGSGGNISVRTVKIMTDGVLENYTGSLLEPYHDGCGGDNVGLSYLDSDELAAAVTELDRVGFGVHMHAIGDRACRDSLDAVAAAQAANGVSDNRHHIAHIQLIDPADLPRFSHLGVTANMQAYWAQRDGQLEKLTRPFLGDERTDRMYPFADLRSAGARIAAGSDWPVSTPDPLAQIAIFERRPLRIGVELRHHRLTREDQGGRPNAHEEDTVRIPIKTRPEHTTWAIRDVWIRPTTHSRYLRIGVELGTISHPRSGDPAGSNLEAWSMLAALAQATRRIRIGCQVSGMIYRHPALLANIAASVDIISAGRLELGVGAGWNQQECDAYGIELPPLKERFDRFDEGVQAIIGLLTQEQTTFQGQYVKLTEAFCEPKPVQRPHPPIVIGGKGPNRTLRAVAKWAQQWNAITESPEQWRELKEVLVTRCAEVGRDPAEITCSVNVRIDPAEPLERAAETAAAYGIRVI